MQLNSPCLNLFSIFLVESLSLWRSECHIEKAKLVLTRNFSTNYDLKFYGNEVREHYSLYKLDQMKYRICWKFILFSRSYLTLWYLFK